ncbi:MAG: cytochrome-c peroxidase [Chitinophagaceae bacterium]|nr:cytochrome-c peroxidase [Chitinophagaceae bacterium]
MGFEHEEPPLLFWDGRASTLEDQSLMPIQNPDEMGLPIEEAVKRLNQSKEYKLLFQKYSDKSQLQKTWQPHFLLLKKHWKPLTVSLMTGATILKI